MISYIVRYIVDKKAGRWMKKNRNTFDDNEKGCTFAIERWLQKKERFFAAISLFYVSGIGMLPNHSCKGLTSWRMF